jgi:hypothetical protein
MPFKPNYRFERIERERKKQAKKEEKLKRRQENAALGEPGVEAEDGEPAPHPEG